MRMGSANNIYVVPAPSLITFGTATLLSAGCCFLTVLSLTSLWNKILEVNWRARFGAGSDDEAVMIETGLDRDANPGTSGPTGNMTRVNRMSKVLLRAVEVPFFGAAYLAMLVVGEINFFSAQMNYQTEPFASIGE
jgi:hypothetical protein